MNNPTRILVVESNLVIASSLVEALEAESHAVHVCNDNIEGLKELASWSPDLITTDLASYADGLAFCGQIRARSNVPIIVISARLDEASKVGAFDAGAIDYVTKPFSMSEVAARIRAQLRRRAYAKTPTRDQILDHSKNIKLES